MRTTDDREIRPETHERFQGEQLFERAAFAKDMKRVSQHDYGNGLPKIASSFGFKKTSASRKWIKATAAKIEELQKRDQRPFDIRAP